MGRRRCCCGCKEYTDTFDRADNDDLTYWKEESGSWSIAANQAMEAGTSGAIVIYKTKLPTQWMRARIQIVDEKEGDVYKLYVSWKNAANHVYAMYEILSSTQYRLSIHAVLAGVDEELDVVTETYESWGMGSRYLSVCNAEQIVSASIEDASMCTVFSDGGISVDPEAKLAGFGHGNGHSSWFDNWYVGEADHKKNCPCFHNDCTCGTHRLPIELHGVYQGEGDCDNLDDIAFTLSRTRCGADAVGGTFAGVQDGSCLDKTRYEIECTGGPVQDWTLHVSSAGADHGCGYEGDAYLQPAQDSTCDPLYLRYCVDVENPTGLPLCGDCLPCGEGGGVGCMDPGDPSFPCPRITYCIIITE